MQVAEQLARRGVEVVWLEVGPSGLVEPDVLEAALRTLASRRPVLVAVQAVNHETGVIQPINRIANVAHALGAELHVDAVQAVGKLEPCAWLGADTISVAAHKLRGPKGVGALALRAGLAPVPVLRGGAQERGFRPGTVDPAALAGFGLAAQRAGSGPARYEALAPLRDRLEGAIIDHAARLGRVVARNGSGPRVPHVSNLRVEGWAGDELVAALDLEGVCISAGTACAAGTPEASRVIAAMCGAKVAREAIRISLGEETTAAEVEQAISAFGRVLGRKPSTA